MGRLESKPQMFAYSGRLTERQREILLGVLLSFVETAEPIGSKTLARKYVRNLSSATIRNELAELTEKGYLEQPHTSAGRVPTDKTYRFYVDQLNRLPPLPRKEVERIWVGYYQARSLSLEAVLEQTSKVLSSLTHQASVVLLPNLSKMVLSQVRFIKLRPKAALVIVVAKNGMVQDRSVELEEDLPQELLDKIARCLNEEYQGLTLRDIRRRVSLQMIEHKREIDILYRETRKMSQKAFLETAKEGDGFFLGGTNHIFEQPEFQADVDKMRALFETFEKKEKLISILDRCMEAEGISVHIGSENEIEAMTQCALVTRSYGDGTQNLGTLGVVGPKRMPYPRIMALVDQTASVLSQVLAAQAAR
ncbi:MAG: heat-inducible transcription repressor HrcA [Candidatus Tectomicrobia bacterium]|nr:heat-inducible transcription repressor HrcA [Candidatus Tectomicrobia bacterium]